MKPDTSRPPSLAVLLDRYEPEGKAETADLHRARELAGTGSETGTLDGFRRVEGVFPSGSTLP